MGTPSAPVRVKWAKANSDAQNNYKIYLREKLKKLTRNIQCNDHGEELEDYTMNVMEAIEAAAMFAYTWWE